MAPSTLQDGSADDFAAGATDDGAYVARTAGGEVVLAPTVAAEFSGTALPPGWTVTPWLEGGGGTFDDGMLVLDGARVGCDRLLLSPRSIELAAVFAARPDQHAGFGINFVDVPWVMFSTKWGRRLYGRSHLLNVEDKRLTGDWFGSRHVFRIDWNILDVVFSVDAVPQARFMVPVPGHMRALAANQRLGGAPLRLEWMRVSPYARAGRFTSRVFAPGGTVGWGSPTWQADEPAGTSVDMRVRTGDTPRPDRTWSPWTPVDGRVRPARTSRCLQYRADLATTDPSTTPVLRRVDVPYSVVEGSSSSSGSTSGAGFQ